MKNFNTFYLILYLFLVSFLVIHHSKTLMMEGNPVTKTGWQSNETRGCVILETENYGLVALMPIAMAVVGSVNIESNVKPGTKVKKGDMLGNFAFGGSDFVMLFQDNVQFTLTAPKQDNGQHYKHLLMGEQLGIMSKKK